jgi:hypothetical protein
MGAWALKILQFLQWIPLILGAIIEIIKRLPELFTVIGNLIVWIKSKFKKKEV